MGEAEERLVLDYLGRVADLAHGRLTPEARVAFLGRLRAGIEEQRAGRDGGRRHTLEVLDKLGDPKRLVEAECLRLIDQDLRNGHADHGDLRNGHFRDGDDHRDDDPRGDDSRGVRGGGEDGRGDGGRDAAVSSVPDWSRAERSGGERRSRGRRARGGRRRVSAADLRRRATRIEREPPPWRRERGESRQGGSVRDESGRGGGGGPVSSGGLVAEGFNPVSGAEALEILRTHRRESVALLLAGVGGLVFPYLFWPVGAFMVLGSVIWLAREKWIGLGAPLAIMALAVISTGSSRANPRAGTDFYAYWSALLDVGPTAFRLAAVGGSAYLFFRLLRNA